jgi:para-nitrobenzyl esterase
VKSFNTSLPVLRLQLLAGFGAPGAKVMSDRLASAWVAFAKTGDPNNPQIPHWPACDAVARATMVLDSDTRAENDPRGEVRKFWEKMPSAASLRG